MHFSGPIVRPQTDADSLFIEVTVGCTHNSCRFCNFYEGVPFRMAKLEDIESDLKEAKGYLPTVRKIWANGGNPFVMSTEKQIRVGDLRDHHGFQKQDGGRYPADQGERP